MASSPATRFCGTPTPHIPGVDAARVAITAGCNQAFFAALLTLVPRGRAVLLPTPWYYNHKMTCDMLGLEARALPCRAEDGFLPDPDAAARLMHGVAAVVLVTPNNPTGAIYPAALVERFASLCRQHGAWLLVDETYRDVLPPGLSVAVPEDAVRLYSFSKAYAVPGHRIGALTLPDPALLPQLMKVLDCMHICPQRPAQSALAWAVEGGWEPGATPTEPRSQNARPQSAAVSRRSRSGGSTRSGRISPTCAPPVSRRVRLGGGGTPGARHGVMLLPAPAFAGSDDHLRVSFANVNGAGIERLAERLAGVDQPALAA